MEKNQWLREMRERNKREILNEWEGEKKTREREKGIEGVREKDRQIDRETEWINKLMWIWKRERIPTHFPKFKIRQGQFRNRCHQNYLSD